MQKTIILALLVASSTARAQAEWVPVPLSNPNKVVLIDNNSLYVSGTVRRAWFKYVMPLHAVKGPGTYQDRFLAYTLMRVAFDCEQKNSKTDAAQWFFEDGTNKVTTISPPPEWTPVAPESMADALLNYICALKSK